MFKLMHQSALFIKKIVLLCALILSTQSCAGDHPPSASPSIAENRISWVAAGESALQQALERQPNKGRAKNIILFLGDGNGVASVTATRIFDGQSRGESGEENQLAYEKFPNVALSKTYNTNQQTPDSAGTMTAIMTGVKTRAGIISLDQSTRRADCQGVAETRVGTFLEQMADSGKATGIISTARITHATPAATYAHSPERDWEADTDIPENFRNDCPDIARQLIEFDHGNGIDLILGGGRANFFPEGVTDPEYPNIKGRRTDGRNLIQAWLDKTPGGEYLWNRTQFQQLQSDEKNGAPVLALFEPSHMQFEADRPKDSGGEPSLAEMTAFAINRLSQNENGYFLMVESGRIDHAHHLGNAHRALKDGQAFSDAVAAALERVDLNDTLIIVTADHSHVLTMAGYPTRGNPILGKVINNDDHGEPEAVFAKATDGKPYTTLGYHNGGANGHPAGRRISEETNTQATDYQQDYLVPTEYETHGGEDVAIYATGPWAHLIHGVQEQSYIYYVMRHAAGDEAP